MKCPKCGYLGFEHVERCRNCGYDFLLSRSTSLPELPLKQSPAAEPNPLADLELVDRRGHVDTVTFVTEMDKDLDRVLKSSEPLAIQLLDVGEPAAPPAALRVPEPAVAPLRAVPAPAPAAGPASRMPLFQTDGGDDAPLISRPSPPRQPLAVRRATPEVARPRAETSRVPSLDLPLEPALPEQAARSRPAHTDTPPSVPVPDGDLATMSARLAAVAIDLFILATIDAAVIYFTLQICGLSLADLAIVPKAPLVAFLFGQNGGYLVAFTAGGQTLGKMAAGIKVVPTDAHAHLDVGRALRRTLLWVVLAVPAGLGFISAFFSREHRGLHDRFAGTRVVRASA